MSKEMSRIKVDPTQVIDVEEDSEAAIEAELREMDKQALLQRLNFEESDPKIIKLIKKILKEK